MLLHHVFHNCCKYLILFPVRCYNHHEYLSHDEILHDGPPGDIRADYDHYGYAELRHEERLPARPAS